MSRNFLESEDPHHSDKNQHHSTGDNSKPTDNANKTHTDAASSFGEFMSTGSAQALKAIGVIFKAMTAPSDKLPDVLPPVDHNLGPGSSDNPNNILHHRANQMRDVYDLKEAGKNDEAAKKLAKIIKEMELGPDLKPEMSASDDLIKMYEHAQKELAALKKQIEEQHKQKHL